MDISVHSPHGDADVTVIADATSTIADLVVAVTGQAVPRLVLVDGHPVPSSTPLSQSGARIGSVLTVEDGSSAASPASRVRLVQLAGPGTGRTVALEPGRYRLGPARRLSDHELCAAAVETTALELVVGDDDEIRATAIADDVRVGDGVPAGSVLPIDRAVATTTRAFTVEYGTPPAPRPDAIAPDGRVLVNRPPTTTTWQPPRRPVLDATIAAELRTPDLWPRRLAADSPAGIPVGIRVAGDGAWTTVTVPLIDPQVATGGVGLVGTEATRSGLARALIAELTVVYSPAEVRIVVVTTNAPSWEWVKWLPHARRQGPPAIIGPDDLDIVFRADPGITSVIVVDDPVTWMRPDSALRGRWSDLPPATAVVAMCSTRSEVPSICTSTIDEQRSGRISVSGARRTTVTDVIASVADSATVERLARHLAPLTDADDTEPRADPPPVEWSSLCGLTDDVDVDTILTRWGDRPDLATPASVVVRAPSLQAAVDVAAGLTVDQALRRSPDALRIVAFTDRESALDRLPHSEPSLPLDQLDDAPTLTRIGVDRFARRLRSRLSAPDGPDHAVIVATSGRHDPPGAERVLAELAALAADDVTVMIATDVNRPLAGVVADRIVEVEESIDEFRLRIDDADGSRIVSVVRPRPSGLDVRAFVHGRHPTPTERRIDQQRRRLLDPVLERLVRLALDATGSQVEVAPLVPAACPDELDLTDLLERHPGDAVPLGVVDRPELDDASVWWWGPDIGSMLAVGGGSSHVHGLLRAILTGAAARYGDDEVGIVTITPAHDLRATASELAQSRLVISPDQLDTDAAERIQQLLHHDTPTAVLIDDLTAVRGSAPMADVDRWLRDLAARPGVVAVAADVGVFDDFSGRFQHRVVGLVTDDEATRLGLVRPPTGAAHAVLLGSEERITLATVTDSAPGGLGS